MKFLHLLTLFILFFIVFGVNLALIGYGYQKHLIVMRRHDILQEIERVKPISSSIAIEATVLGAVEDEVTLADSRAENLRRFFRKYNSPLYDFADLVIQTSDKYGIDYRLIPAIGMQESKLCAYAPKDSYNCWGYGIYADKIVTFSSYEEAIETVGKGLRTNYLDKGYTTPEVIMKKYTPSSDGSWAHSINFFLNMLE